MPDGSSFQRIGETTSHLGHSLAGTLRRAPWLKIFAWAGGILAALLVIVLLILTFANWNALRGPIGKFASAAAGRDVVIAGDLKVHPWSFTPSIEVNDLRIGNPYWGQRRKLEWAKPDSYFARVPRANARIEFWPLLTGDVVFRELELTQPDVRLSRDAQGLANWGKDPSAKTQNKPLQLPLMKRFDIKDGQLNFTDGKRKVTLQARVNSGETLGGDGGFGLNGDGTLNNQPFKLVMTGGGLLKVNRNKPYAFKFDLNAGPTHIVADGAIARPFDLSRYAAYIKASGNDLADIYAIIGLALPNTPPYDLRTRLSRTPKGYTLADIAGRVGDSDLAGRMDVLRDRPRKKIEANITSKSLDFDDLAAVLGAPPSIDQGEAASPEQRAEAARLARQGRVLPDARLRLDKVRSMDAHLNFKAARVVDAPFPLRSATLELTLDNGVMKFTPVMFELPRGNLNAFVTLDARKDVPVVDMDARIRKARIEDFFKTKDVIEGGFVARAKLRGTGDTVREAAASSNGTVTMVMPRGQVREAFAELTGINVARGLGLYLSGDKSQTDLRCGVASFEVKNGVARPSLMVFDTEDIRIHGGGNVDLRNETMDLKIQGDSKKPRFLKVDAPIKFTGHWRTPKVGVEADDAVKQGVIGGLASLINPLAALLPFVDAGLAEDADCKAMLTRKTVTQAAK